jgi:death-on-curing protein
LTRFVSFEAAQQIVQYHGFYIQDAGLLGSAIARPSTSLFGEDAYPAFELKAAAMMHSVIKNHALVDGNKRTAWSLFYFFLYINDVGHTMNDDQGFDLVLGLATDKYTIEQAAEIIGGHLAPLKR